MKGLSLINKPRRIEGHARFSSAASTLSRGDNQSPVRCHRS